MKPSVTISTVKTPRNTQCYLIFFLQLLNSHAQAGERTGRADGRHCRNVTQFEFAECLHVSVCNRFFDLMSERLQLQLPVASQKIVCSGLEKCEKECSQSCEAYCEM